MLDFQPTHSGELAGSGLWGHKGWEGKGRGLFAGCACFTIPEALPSATVSSTNEIKALRSYSNKRGPAHWSNVCFKSAQSDENKPTMASKVGSPETDGLRTALSPLTLLRGIFCHE